MADFRDQIREDIKLIQRDYGYLDENLQRDEFAFNYWILSRLYGLDEEVIPEFVTDIHDKGIDCYVHYEETKELYIIQNKYYDENTPVSRSDVADFLKTPLSVLLSGQYHRSKALQRIFDRIHSEGEYNIWLHFYVTNNTINKDIDDLIESFSFHNDEVSAVVGVKYYKLDDIKTLYYGERFTNKVSFTAKLTTRVSATSLDVRPKDYGLDWMIDLRFIMVNVVDLYKMYKEASKRNYQLFEENVREFLGTQGINNGIIKTLQSSSDRENFFYYNNGITIICKECKTLRGTEASSQIENVRNQYGFKLVNPQVVNGCQTINSIAEVLSHCNEKSLYEEFKKTFVLVKIYVFDEKAQREKNGLDKKIVKYTNSQNGIDEKAFASKSNYFLNIQEEFKKRGVLLLVKPSDKYKYALEFEDKSAFAELKRKSHDLFKLFDLDETNIKNYMISLEKLLKVLLAFSKDGYTAFKKGNSVLKINSPFYRDFSLNIHDSFTVDEMIKLYFLFNKAEYEKKGSADNRTPIPYYVLGFLGKEFKNLESDIQRQKLGKLFGNKDYLNDVYGFYKNLTSLYAEEYAREHNKDYNTMIKLEIDVLILDRIISQMLKYGSNDSVKDFLSKT